MGQRELATTDFAKSPFNNEEEEPEEEEEKEDLCSKTNRSCHSVACCPSPPTPLKMDNLPIWRNRTTRMPTQFAGIAYAGKK